MQAAARLDARALLALYGGSHGAWAWLMIALTAIGSGWAALLLLPMMAHRRTRRFAIALAAGLVVQSALVDAVKALTGRVRPWIALGLPPPIGEPRGGSFPSGHASGSFCVATFLAVTLPVVWHAPRGRVRLAVVGCMVLAALIAFSRVYLGAHFPGDVLGGAVLGAVCGAVAGRLYASRAQLTFRVPLP